MNDCPSASNLLSQASIAVLRCLRLACKIIPAGKPVVPEGNARMHEGGRTCCSCSANSGEDSAANRGLCLLDHKFAPVRKTRTVQLNPFDLVVLLTLSNTVQNAIIGDDNTVTGGVIGATSLLVVKLFVVPLFVQIGSSTSSSKAVRTCLSRMVK